MSCDNEKLWMWDINTLKNIKIVNSNNGSAWSVKNVHNSNKLIVGTSHGYIEERDLRNMDNCVRSFKAHNDGISCLHQFSDGYRIVTGSRDKRIKVIEAKKMLNYIY